MDRCITIAKRFFPLLLRIVGIKPTHDDSLINHNTMHPSYPYTVRVPNVAYVYRDRDWNAKFGRYDQSRTQLRYIVTSTAK